MANTRIVDRSYSIYKLRWCTFRELNRGKCAVTCNLNSNLVADMYKLAKRYEELGRAGIAMKSAVKKGIKGKRERRDRGTLRMVGLDLQLQTRRSIERIIPRSRLS